MGLDNISQEDYAVYAAGGEENVLNATMKWYTEEKRELLFEEYEATVCEFNVD